MRFAPCSTIPSIYAAAGHEVSALFLLVMSHRDLLIMPTFRAREVAGAAGGVGGDDGSLVVVVGVAALRALLAVGDHRAAFVYDDPTCNLYSQHFTSADPELLVVL